MVDIKAEKEFEEPITRDELKNTTGLEDMMLLQRGSRLSIQPVSLLQWQIITNIAANKGSGK